MSSFLEKRGARGDRQWGGDGERGVKERGGDGAGSGKEGRVKSGEGDTEGVTEE